VWRMEAPEVRSEAKLYSGPSSGYQPIMSVWNGTAPEWKSNAAMFGPVEDREEIQIVQPTKVMADLHRMDAWPSWDCDPSEFEWKFGMKEVAYVVAGEAEIIPFDGRRSVRIKPGDVVTFPAGMECEWKVKSRFRKHYRFIPAGVENPYTFPSTASVDRIPKKFLDVTNKLQETREEGLPWNMNKGAMLHWEDENDRNNGFKL